MRVKVWAFRGRQVAVLVSNAVQADVARYAVSSWGSSIRQGQWGALSWWQLYAALLGMRPAYSSKRIRWVSLLPVSLSTPLIALNVRLFVVVKVRF